MWGAALATLAVDQASKVWALAALKDGRSHEILGGVLTLRLLRNSGAAFSLGSGRTWLMTLVAVVIVVAVLRTVAGVRSRPWAVLLGLVLGGALGNLADRFFRQPGPGRGDVVDFIDYGGLFVGNVADIAIVLAAIGIAWLALRGIPLGEPPSTGRHGQRPT